MWEYVCDDHGCSDPDCQGSAGGHYHSALACGKARVTPLQGYTVPRSELSGATLVSRMISKVVYALQHLDVKPVSAIMMLDSKCTISLLDANSKILKPFFQNRRAEIIENIAHVRKVCPMEDPHYVAGTLNVADMFTRGAAKVVDIGPGSLWQSGPQFLVLGRDKWPVTRDFVRTDLPVEEVKSSDKFMVACLRSEAIVTVAAAKSKKTKSVAHGSKEMIGKPAEALARFENILLFKNDMQSRIRVVARVQRGWKTGMIKNKD